MLKNGNVNANARDLNENAYAYGMVFTAIVVFAHNLTIVGTLLVVAILEMRVDPPPAK